MALKRDEKILAEIRRNQFKKLAVAGAAMLVVLATLLFFTLRSGEGFGFAKPFETLIVGLAIAAAMGLAASVLLGYLQRDREADRYQALFGDNVKINEAAAEELNNIRAMLQIQQVQLQSLAETGHRYEAGIGEAQKEQLLLQLKGQFRDLAAADVVKELEAKVREKIQAPVIEEGVDVRAQTTIRRLGQELNALERRGNLNLVLSK